MNNINNNNNNNILNNNILDNLFRKSDKVMILKLFIDMDDDVLKQIYEIAIKNHNERLLENPHIDAGVDIFNPTEITVNCSQVNKIDFNVICEASIVTDQYKEFPTGFYMYPRSSLSKTPLRLANSVGIIDAGYRGHLIGAFDLNTNTNTNTNTILPQYDRYVQICAPTLCPVYVFLVDSITQLEETNRGFNGFGSTGR